MNNMKTPPPVWKRIEEIQNFCAPKIVEQVLASMALKEGMDIGNERILEHLWRDKFFQEIKEVVTLSIEQLLDFYDLQNYACEVELNKAEPGAFKLRIWKKRIIV